MSIEYWNFSSVHTWNVATSGYNLFIRRAPGISAKTQRRCSIPRNFVFWSDCICARIQRDRDLTYSEGRSTR